MPLITTPGAANANAYATVAEMDACLASNPYASGWNVVSTANKEAFGEQAARLLDGMPAAWTGRATNPGVQGMRWPRLGMKNRNDFPIPNNVIPGNLKCAQAEYARLLAENDLTAGGGAASAAAQGISSVSAAGVSVSLGGGGATGGVVAGASPNVGPLSDNFGKKATLHAQVPASVIMYLIQSWLLDPRDKDALYNGLIAEVL